MKTNTIGLITGPILFAITIALPMGGGAQSTDVKSGQILSPLSFSARVVLATTLWMATDRIVFLFLGGFLLARAIEKARLHERIALNILKMFGTNPKYIVASFIIVTGFLSAWISNTATTMLMIPIAAAVISQVSRTEHRKVFGLCLMLSIAYSASLGGMATLIGTPPNAIFASLSKSILNVDISFGQWTLIGMPISALSLFITWFYIVNFRFRISHISITEGKHIISNRLSNLGRITSDEKIVSAIFVATAIAWITRGLFWKEILPMIDDTTIVLASSFVLFLIPSATRNQASASMEIDKESTMVYPIEDKISKHGKDDNDVVNSTNATNNRRLLDWHDTVKIPWGVILLIGGGLALASGFSATGLDAWIANQLFNLVKGMNYILTATIIVALAIIISELISNTATAALMIPISASLAGSLNIDPLVFMIPVTLATSYGFVMPAGTPPNAIVFGSGYVSAKKMAKVGFPLDIIGIVIVVFVSTYIINLVL